MFNILSVILFVISATLDSLVVGVAYGMRRLKISILSNTLIAFIGFISTYLSMVVGKFIESFISSRNSSIIGSIFLIVIGLWFILNTILKTKKDKAKINDYDSTLLLQKQNKIESYTHQCEELLTNPEKADIDNSGNIDLREAIMLGFALALNNMGLGIGASIAGLNIKLTSLLTFIFSFMSIPLGYSIGKKFLSQVFNKKADIISGTIIIFLGLCELLYNLKG